MFGAGGPWELLIIAMIVLLLFGKRLPSVMRSLGSGVKEFQSGIKGVTDEVNRDIDQSS